MSDIASRLAAVRARVPDRVTLIAVSKMQPSSAIREAYAAGQRDFGENYAQELATKRIELADLMDLRWHFIGALQSNKAKLVIPGTALVHTLDRLSLAEALAKRATQASMTCEALIEVNVGGEVSKAGIAPAAVEALLAEVAPMAGIRIRGLMCIPPPSEGAAGFRILRELRDGLRPRFPALELLSMGMTSDFEDAIAEGATHVRVGTAIFGARPVA